LRGLKPPRDAFEAENVAVEFSGSEPGVKWRAVDALQDLAPRLTLYGGALETHQFRVSDVDVRTSLYRPLSALGAGNPTASYDALPKYILYRNVNQSFGGGWGLGFGVRQTEYNLATNNLYSVSAERYLGNFRGAYTLYSSRTEGADLGSARRFQVNYFYGDRNTVGLAYTTGRDIENLGMSPGLPLNDARDVTLSGRHWLTPNWALTYDLLSHEQGGSLYKRQGLRLGVSRSF
jgi:YaiO family outer membrane protein